MKSIFKTGIVLFLICAVCASLCAWVNSFTAPVIKENMEKANRLALEKVSQGLTIGETKTVENNAAVKEITALSKDDSVVGYVLLLSGKGYGGDLSIIASYDKKGALLKAQMTQDSETAGLGKNAESEWYMELFSGMGDTIAFPNGKNDLGEKEKALVTGASFTFRAVSETLRNGSNYVKEMGL